ncbi:4-hydroxy-tetrahydrodipicolinate reductase [Spiribacter sp. 1M153]|uniref:4-hydroxy-tetrahydrodipicolinate reductase n=1 Tax=Spiribacter roseus TaxID=1855875 RepID=A0ABV3RWL5_9GAMM|nr:4-hydroxy-tetrahydrodipicolinate reductase [Spiribacter sp. SSL99]AUB78406.1 4-hydroxy-tetrahydrodipicolinate reductase [Spiribacter roseus]KAF0284827.1 4-hydroxy-tetrahydrodipicolinate reductase [Spiribacter sp. SSL99]
MTKVAILGASGRMGRTLIGLVAAADDLQLVGATTRADSPSVGSDAGLLAGCGALDVTLTASAEAALADADVAIDFTLPAALADNLTAARSRGCALVIGTTGVDADGIQAIDATARSLPVVFAANYSSGVTLLQRLVRTAAAALGSDYDVEIVEAHHRGKRDAPSGTARALGQSVADGRGVDLEENAVYAREGMTGERPVGAIGFQALRGGDIVGEHTVMLAGEGERLELTHRAASRETFARGALRAARWVISQPPGRFDMDDVLGLSD